ncbi:MAG: hypothetical protein ABJF11_05275 [Reichenbachiella sp.]|uniref:hypothetical protein n=1 Tax=Reichenbachiella sp. TaxID=2184521 RepID=UPI0032635F66
MSRNKAIEEKRKRLQSEEKKIAADLEQETVVLESKVQSGLKTLAIAGAGLLTAIALYKLIASDDEKPKEKKSEKRKKVTSSMPSPITASVISLVIQKLLPLALEKISSFNSKDTKNEHATKSASR